MSNFNALLKGIKDLKYKLICFFFKKKKISKLSLQYSKCENNNKETYIFFLTALSEKHSQSIYVGNPATTSPLCCMDATASIIVRSAKV